LPGRQQFVSCAVEHSPPGQRVHVFDRYGHAMQRPIRRVLQHLQRPLREPDGDRVEPTVSLLQAAQGPLQQVARVQFAAGDGRGLRTQDKGLRLRHPSCGALEGSRSSSAAIELRSAAFSASMDGDSTACSSLSTSRSPSSSSTPWSGKPALAKLSKSSDIGPSYTAARRGGRRWIGTSAPYDVNE